MHRFSFPTDIVLGSGAVAEIAPALIRVQATRPLILADPAVAELGLTTKLAEHMPAGATDHRVFTDLHPNPSEADCEAALDAYRDHRADSIVALGGGSAIDLAKAVRVLATHPGPIALYEEGRGGTVRITEPMPPLIAVPTTAGTGSEVGRSAVIILRESGAKSVVFHPGLIPDLAILDPDLTIALPAPVTAATGIDALTHCIEAFLAPAFHPICDGIALEGIKLITRHLGTAVRHGNDLVARERMLLAAAMGAIAFQKGLGMVHSLAHPLSAEFDMHHGLANALMIADSMAFIEGRAPTGEPREKLDIVGRQLPGAPDEALSARLRRFTRDLLAGADSESPMGLARHGIKENDLPRLAHLAFTDGIHETNLVPVTEADLLSVYRQAW